MSFESFVNESRDLMNEDNVLVNETIHDNEDHDSLEFEDIAEIRNLKLFSQTIGREMLELENQENDEVVRELHRAPSDSDDDDYTGEVSALSDALFLDDIDRYVAERTPSQTPFGSSLKSKPSFRDPIDKGFTPMTMKQIMDLDTPYSGIDHMLETLKKYRNKDITTSVSISVPVTPIIKIKKLGRHRTTNDFFDPMLDSYSSDGKDEDEHETESVPFSPILISKSTGNLADQGISIESLRRNWELEEDLHGGLQKIVSAELNLKRDYHKTYMERSTSLSSISPMKSEITDDVLYSPSKRVDDEWGRVVAAVADELAREDNLSDHNHISSFDHEPDVDDDDGDLGPAPTITTNQPELLHDDRVKVDFTVWRSGAKLTWQGLKDCYTGLYDMALPGSGMSLTSNNSSVVVLECVVRPDVELKRLMAVILRSSHALGCRFQLCQRSHAIVTRESDIPASLGSSLSNTFSSFVPKAQSQVEEEWEVMEAQVCISKELQQRVLLCVFMRRSNSRAISSNKSSLPVIKIASTIQRFIVSGRLCLSSLYSASLSSVCPAGRLDSHFVAQLTTLYRESMWNNLNDVYHAMDQYVKIVESTTSTCASTMDTIYKQYGLTMPMKPNQTSDEVTATNESTDLNVYSIDENEESPHDDYNDGMTKCLSLLANLLSKLQHKFDEEFTFKLQRRHDVTIGLIDDIVAYRRSLLTNIAYSKVAQTSSLTKTYQSIFSSINLSPIQPIVPSAAQSTRAVALQGMRKYMSVNAASSKKWDAIVVDKHKEPIERTKSLRIDTKSHDIDSSTVSSNDTPIKEKDQSLHIEISSPSESHSSRIYSPVWRSSPERSNRTIEKVKAQLDKYELASIAPTTAPFNVVLYYCACIANGMPGTLYVTPYNVSVVSSLMALRQFKDSFSLSKLLSVTVQQANTLFIQSNSLRIAYYRDSSTNKRELIITPLVEDANKVRMVISDAAATFGKYADSNNYLMN